MKNTLFVIIFIFPAIGFAQGVSFYGTGALNAGFKNQIMDFGGSKAAYGHGSGIALHLGAQLESNANFFFYTELGLNVSLAYQYESYNGYSNKSAFSFNYKSASIGVGKLFPFGNSSFFDGLRLNAGADFNIPGTASLTENNQYIGSIEYANSLGFHIEGKVSFLINEVLFIEPGIGYNQVSFNSTEYDWKNGQPGVANLFPNASSISVSVTFRKSIGSRDY